MATAPSVDVMSSSVLRICFVCLGNICRSPAAEAVFAHAVDRAGLGALIDVDSAGTSGYHVGDPPHDHTQAEARRRGLAMDHCGRRFTADDFARFDLVVAMDSANVRELRRFAPDDDAKEKVVLLRSFDPVAEGHDDLDLADPWGLPARQFAVMFDDIERAADGLIAHVRQRVEA